VNVGDNGLLLLVLIVFIAVGVAVILLSR